MTTYSLSGFTAVFDTNQGTVASVADVTMDFVWFEEAAATLRYDYTGGGLTVALTAANAVDTAINGDLSLTALGLVSTDEVFTIEWDANGVTRQTTVLARMVAGADLNGPAADRSVFGVFALGGDALPPIPTEAYFARFMLTQLDQTSYELPSGDLSPSQQIDLETLASVTISEVDHVTGTDAADVLKAGSGADTLLGKGGDDVINGQNGTDWLSGGAGQDTLNGGNGEDTLSYLDETGTSGVIVALSDGTATDTYGDVDVISNFEHVRGSVQDDTISGDDFANVVWGHDGADSLRGGSGNDTLTGGAGDDTLVGGSEQDEADYSSDGGVGGITANMGTGVVTDSHGDTDVLIGIESIMGTKYGDLMTGAEGRVTLHGFAGPDTLIGANGDEEIQGGGGADLVTGDAGDDTLAGGDGSDTLSYVAETGSQGIDLNMEDGTVTDTHGDHDTVSGFELIEGSGLNDVMWAAAAGSWLSGAEGQDTLRGRSGSDTLEGGGGQDTFAGGAGNDIFDGGADIDALDYGLEDGSVGIDADLGAGIVTDTHGNTDQVSLVENVFGTAAADLIRGDDFANFLSGDDGKDQLYGMDGDDSLEGGAGEDTIGAGDGNDTLRAGDGHDVMGGGYGDDFMDGESGRDELRAGYGNDTLYGGDSRDSLLGGYGNDWLYGGEGNDELVGSYDKDVLFGEGGNDNMGGGNQSDKMYGGDGDDTLSGGHGDDELYGNSGNDFLVGGDHNDMLRGGTGQDTLRAGQGDDVLTGGADADVFLFTSLDSAGSGEISDFDLGVDLLEVAGFDATSNAPDVSVMPLNGTDTMVLDCDGFLIWMVGIDPSTPLNELFEIA